MTIPKETKIELRDRRATIADAGMLAKLNRQLILDEKHRNQMSVQELEARMRGWLEHEYEAVIFELDGKTAAYALLRRETEYVYLRQFLVKRELRRQGIGKRAIDILLREIAPERCRLVLEVLIANTSGREFWKAVGFRDYAITMEYRGK